MDQAKDIKNYTLALINVDNFLIKALLLLQEGFFR